MGASGAVRTMARSSETGWLRRSMSPPMSAGWGNPVESSGLPCGKFGVTPWKSWGNPVENSALPQGLILLKLLTYVLRGSIVIDEFRASNLAGKGPFASGPKTGESHGRAFSTAGAGGSPSPFTLRSRMSGCVGGSAQNGTEKGDY